MKKIYLDNGASTMIDPKVLKAMDPYLIECYGNASSSHECGVEAHTALLIARDVVADALHAKAEEIVFTSGGTESNNFVTKGLFWEFQKIGLNDPKTPKKNHIVTTKVEHNCILNSCKWLESQGAFVTYLDVDNEGFVRPSDLEEAIKPETFLVSIIHGNNEIGTVQDLEVLGEICRRRGVLFHIDACQSFTKVPIDVKKLPVDLTTLNSHKIHGPKGVGALYIREGVELTPLMHGGGHEKGRRGGTENIAGIVGFAEAIKRVSHGDIKDMAKLRNFFIEEVLKNVPDALLNGPMTGDSGDQDGKTRLCNNVNFTFTVNGEMLGGYLNAAGVCTSKGSACSNNEGSVSHVLQAIGRSQQQAGNSIRFTLSRFTTKKELEEALEILFKSIEKVRKSRFA